MDSIRYATKRALTASALAAFVAGALTTAAKADGPGGPGDYLVIEGKRTVWASQVRRQPKVTDPSTASTVKPGRLGTVIVGKRSLVTVDGVVRDAEGTLNGRPLYAATEADRNRAGVAAGDGTSKAVSSEKPGKSRWRLVEDPGGKRRWYVRTDD
jgi:hypothetical protein